MPRPELPYSEKSRNTLIVNYYQLRAAGKPIPADLLYWLSVKASDQFGPNGPLCKHGQRKNAKPYSQMSLDVLEKKVRELIKSGKKVPQGLGKELVLRKPEKYSYDENGEFNIKKYASEVSRKQRKPYIDCGLAYLENLLKKYNAAGEQPPVDLMTALAVKAPEKYFYENGEFKNLHKERAERRIKKKNRDKIIQPASQPKKLFKKPDDTIIAKQKELAGFATEKQIAGVHLFAPKLPSGAYELVWRHGVKEKKLMIRCGIYSPEVVLFDVLSGFAVVRVHGNFGTKLYVIDCENSEVIKSLAGGFARVSYIAKNHELFGYEKIDARSMLRIWCKNHTWTRESVDAPYSAVAINALAKLTETVIIKPNGMCATYPLAALPAQLDKAVPATEYKKEARANQTSDVTDLNVTIKSTESASGIFYNDVYVNGQRIIQSHYNTSFKVFMNGKILGVRGRDGNEMAPMGPWQWRLFDTNLDEQDFKSTSAYIDGISEESYGIKLRFSNGHFTTLMSQQYENASNKLFRLSNVKKHLYGR